MSEYVSLPGVPESITRKEYLGLIEQLGFDINHLLSLTFERDGIYAEVLATDDNGHHYTADGENAATHPVCVRVVDEEPESEEPA